VLLVARSEDKLIALCNELGRLTSIRAQYLALDLQQHEAGAQLFEETQKRELQIDTLINNAGFGSMGDFAKLDPDRELEMIELNVRAVVDLTHRFLPPMRERKRGTIINCGLDRGLSTRSLHGDVCRRQRRLCFRFQKHCGKRTVCTVCM
jgi:short-subunit dehydrogenase